MTTEETKTSNFIQQIIDEDNKSAKYNNKTHTRFPPEPNGYLHIGHAKSICLNFGLAQNNHGLCNLRFDDTNPSKEELEYVDSIKEDLKWLGFDWDDRLFYASDYFDSIYNFAVKLIKNNNAYVDSLNAEEIREYRGTLKTPGKESPYRNRSTEENLELFNQMKNGKFNEGEHVLRAKIDMSSPNLNMRDPIIYRILKANHHRTGDTWGIYPMYDFTHPISDSIEKITHSVCTLEFEDHRPLYDWVLDQLNIHHPSQIEFARLNITYTVLSKRKLLELVNSNIVNGWDDPRMPTLSGMRRRGYTPASIINFCDRIGVAKFNSTIDLELLNFFLREDLNKTAQRVMAVLDPLKVVITNYPEDKTEELEADNNPEDPDAGKRKIPFSKIVYIERSDFMEDPPKKFFRLAPDREIRLKHAYYVKCTDVIKNPSSGEIIELHCTYDPVTRGGWLKDGRKVKGTAHWVSAEHAISAELRLYDHLFTAQNPDDAADGYRSVLNPDSLKVIKTCMLEPSLLEAKTGTVFQFLRQGYFCVDTESTKDQLIFNQTVTLKDSWAKIEKKLQK